MKKKHLYMLLALLVLGATACSKGTDGSTAETALSTTVESEAGTEKAAEKEASEANPEKAAEKETSEADTEKTVAGETPEAAGMAGKPGVMGRISNTAPVNNGEINGFFLLQGTVKEGGPDNASMTVSLEDGRDFTFSPGEMDVECYDEVTPGYRVLLACTGKQSEDFADTLPVMMLTGQEQWSIRVLSGTTVSNMMSTFTMTTAAGEEIGFLKDNCQIQDGALSRDSGDPVQVTFLSTDRGDNFPLKVEKDQL